MRKFSKILENIQFEGRSTNPIELIEDIIQNIEYSFGEKKSFYNEYLWEDMPDNRADDYLEDLQNGRMREFYRSDKIVDYGELREYLFKTYEFNLDEDTDGVYVDCIWLKYLLKTMTHSALKQINK